MAVGLGLVLSSVQSCGRYQQQQERMKHEWEKEFENTTFAKGGGSCFECCDYEGMYTDLKDFIRTLLASEEARVRGEAVEATYDAIERQAELFPTASTKNIIAKLRALTPLPAQHYSTRIVDEVPDIDWSEPQSKGECCEICTGRVEDEDGFARHYGCQFEVCPCHKEAAVRCKECRSPFQEYQHKHITRAGTYHTNCYKKTHGSLTAEEAAEPRRKGESTTN